MESSGFDIIWGMAVYEQQHLRGVRLPPLEGKGREKFPDLGNKAIVGLFLVTIGLSLFFWIRAEAKEWYEGGKDFSEKIVFWKETAEEKSKIQNDLRLSETKERIKKLIFDLQGEYAVYFKSLEEGKGEWGIDEEREMEAASLIKVPIILTLYKKTALGEIDLETKYVLADKDKVPGAGGMLYKKAGTVYSYRKMAELMGKSSDNTAAKILTRILGAEAIQRAIEDLEMKKTSFGENKTTAKDVGGMFEKLYKNEVLSAEASEEILSFLTKTQFEERIPAGLPEEIRVAHKIGTETEVISDGGIVYGKNPYILVILSERVKAVEAEKMLPEISKVVWEMVNAQ